MRDRLVMVTFGDITKGFCSNCGDDVDHHVAGVCSRTEHWGQVNASGPEYYFRYELIQCVACKRAALREISWFSEDTSSEDGSPSPNVKYAPPRRKRRPPVWLDRLKDEQGANAYRNLPLLLEHVYSAIDNDCLELAAMGIRTMIDVTLQEHIGATKNNFPTKLEKAVKAKLIAQSQSEILLHVLNLGSETSHQLLLPNQDEILMALDIAESLFQQLFIHPQHAETLKRRRDERA
jgi:hypothetical protein